MPCHSHQKTEMYAFQTQFVSTFYNLTSSVPAVVVAVAHPDVWNALIVSTLEVVGGAPFGRTVVLILAAGAVLVSVAPLVERDAEPIATAVAGGGIERLADVCCAALKLIVKAVVVVAKGGLVRTVSAIVA
jgi:hypothetical protein